MSIERTLVLIKPDAVQRGLSGIVLSRLESRGLKPVAMKMLHVSKELASTHYEAQEGKPHYESLVNFITSSPLIALVIEGHKAVEAVRSTMGSTDPVKSQPGTIRGDLGLDIQHNLIHGSDSIESASVEIGLFFSPEEILTYDRDVDRWIIES